MNSIFRSLNQWYYMFYTLVILIAIIGYFLNLNNLLNHQVDKVTFYIILSFQLIISSATVIYYLYYLYKYTVIKRISDLEIRKLQYFKFAKYRILSVGFNLVVGIVLYYFMLSEVLLYIIAPSALLLLLCKPNHNRIEDFLAN